MADVKISRYFPKSFDGKKFNSKQYKNEYSALYQYLGESVIRLNKFNSDKDLDEKDAKEKMGQILEEIEKNARTLFDYYGVDFKADFKFGGLTNKEREKIESAVMSNVQKEKKKKPKDLNLLNDVLGKKKYEDDFIKAIKEDGVLKNLDLSVFGEVLKIAKYTKGELNDKTRDDIIEYIRSFSTEKKGYLYDSTYFYMERSGYKGRNIFEDIENEYKKKDVGMYYNMIAYYVDYFYDMYALSKKLEKDKTEKPEKKEKIELGEEDELSAKLIKGINAKKEITSDKVEENPFELKLKSDFALPKEKEEAPILKQEKSVPDKIKDAPEQEISIKITK